MTTAIKRRRGTTTQHSTFTGLEGEITVDSTKDTVVVHDGSTAGGFALLREDLSNNTNVITTTNTKTLTNKTFSDNPVFSAGTANGVAYLNGSKVLTTGSALTYNGTGLGIGVSSAASPLQIGSVGVTGYNVPNGLVIGDGTRACAIGVETAGVNLYSSSSIVFSPVSTEGMRLTSTGLGIGTSSPSAKLDVQQNTSAVKIFAGGDSSGTNGGIVVSYGAAMSSPRVKAWVNGYQGVLDVYDSDNVNIIKLNGRGDSFINGGNLGLGVTPSAWNTFKAFEIGNAGSGFWSSAVGDLRSSANTYYNSGYKYAGSNLATMYQQASGIHMWFTAPSGTAGNAISFTQAMTLDASGNLALGASATSQNAFLYVNAPTGSADNAATYPTLFINAGNASTTANLIRFNGAVAQGMFMGRATNADALIFGGTSSGELMRIDSSGNVQVSNLAGTGNRAVYSTSTGILTNSSSDRSLKENDTPISQGLDAVLTMRPISYEWIDKEKMGAQREIGFIAQEMQQIVPEVVGSNSDETLSIDYPKLVAVMAKAIQELTARVVALEAK